MKKFILTLLLALAASIAHAHLMDATPGGFTVPGQIPPVFFELSHHTFFDEAAHGFFNLPEGERYLNGWVSRFGTLNGADWFQTNLFQIGDISLASVSWDLAGQQDGFWLSLIEVFGIQDGVTWEHIYRVSSDELFQGQGFVTVNGVTTIMGISFYGTNHVVPDSGWTVALFLIGLVSLYASRNYHFRF